jgi:hypothetical protein
MSKRLRSAPAHLSAYGSFDSQGESSSADEAADRRRAGTSKGKKTAAAAAETGGGGTRGKRAKKRAKRGDDDDGAFRSDAAQLVNSVAAGRSRRQTVMSSAGAAAAAAVEASFEDMAPSPPATSSAPYRSARLQQTKRRSYKDAGSSDDGEDDAPVEEEDSDEEMQTETAARRATPTAGAASSSANNNSKRRKQTSLFLDLNGCLGKSLIERVLARKRMPSPSTLFLSTFIAQMPVHRQRLLHPEDMERFAPQLCSKELSKWKAQQAQQQEQERRRIEQDAAAAMDMGGFSLTSGMDGGVGPTPSPAPSASPDSSYGSYRGCPPLTSSAHDGLEFWYLVKLRDRSYSPLALHWLPHSLMLLFSDGPRLILKFDQTRARGEGTRAAPMRNSFSDDELEADEQHALDTARALRIHKLDEARIQREVEEKEDKLRAQQEAEAQQLQATIAAAAVPSASTATGADGSVVPLTAEQLASMEHLQEAARISRRLADISKDHKVARLKRIQAGFFDMDFGTVERIIGHQRRIPGAHRRLYCSPSTHHSHWTYYGLNAIQGVPRIEKMLISYVTSLDAQVRHHICELAVQLDPRLHDAYQQMLAEEARPAKRRERQPGAKSATPASSPPPGGRAAVAGATADDKEERKTRIRPPTPEAVTPAVAMWMRDVEEGDDEKDQSTSAAAARANTTDTGLRSPTKDITTAPAPTPSPAVPSPPPAVSSTGRPRRLASLKAETVSHAAALDAIRDDAFVHSDDDDDLQAILRSSQLDVGRGGGGRNARADMTPMEEDDGDDDDERDEEEDADEQFEFLVKWSKLPYDEATWETRATLKRLDDMRMAFAQSSETASASSWMSERNPDVPLASLPLLPFQPFSLLLTSSNLLLKYSDLPIVVSDEQHVSLGAELQRKTKEEQEQRAAGKLVSSAYRAPLHPSVSVSSLQGRTAAPVSLSCTESLHRYLMAHSSRTKLAAVVYPSRGSNAGASDAAAPKDRQSPAPFSMQAAAVRADQQFGRQQNMKLRGYQVDGINWSVEAGHRTTLLCSTAFIAHCCL